jgi:hypothetical protein
VRAQVALAIQLLTAAPVRIGNLARIDLERNLIAIGGRRERLHLHVAAGEVKNEVELEFPLGPDTRQLLATYLERFRPRLLRQASRWLFLGGRPDVAPRPRLCLPLAAWPEPDRQAWERATRESDLLEPGGPAARWRPATRRHVVERYGCWLAWLAAQGWLQSRDASTPRACPAPAAGAGRRARSAARASAAMAS